jgi:hypothetical protein
MKKYSLEEHQGHGMGIMFTPMSRHKVYVCGTGRYQCVYALHCYWTVYLSWRHNLCLFSPIM